MSEYRINDRVIYVGPMHNDNGEELPADPFGPRPGDLGTVDDVWGKPTEDDDECLPTLKVYWHRLAEAYDMRDNEVKRNYAPRMVGN